MHPVHPVPVSQWQTVLRERLPELFEAGGKQGADTERRVADLHRKIGKLTVDLDYLRKGPIELPSDIQGIVGKDISNGIKAGAEIRKEVSLLKLA